MFIVAGLYVLNGNHGRYVEMPNLVTTWGQFRLRLGGNVRRVWEKILPGVLITGAMPVGLQV